LRYINSAGGVTEKKRSFVFYTPISIYNLLILDSRSSLFHNYRIWLWAYPGPWAIHGLGGLFWLAHESPGPSTTGANSVPVMRPEYFRQTIEGIGSGITSVPPLKQPYQLSFSTSQKSVPINSENAPRLRELTAMESKTTDELAEVGITRRGQDNGYHTLSLLSNYSR
jgi:hypothetical protein